MLIGYNLYFRYNLYIEISEARNSINIYVTIVKYNIKGFNFLHEPKTRTLRFIINENYSIMASSNSGSLAIPFMGLTAC